jgi:hypothetical protein
LYYHLERRFSVLISTFRELYEKKDSVIYTDLEETLEDYARGGWAIVPWVVNDILMTMGLTSDEAKKLRGLCLQGKQIQARRKQQKTAQEYEEVAEYLRQRIEAMA